MPAQIPRIGELNKTYNNKKIGQTLYIVDFHFFLNRKFCRLTHERNLN